MKPANHSKTSVFPTASSQVSEAQSIGSQTSKAQGEIPTLLNSESSSQDTFIASPQTHPSTEPSHPKRMTQAVVIVVATAMGLTVFSGVLYLILANLHVLQRSQSTVVPMQPGLHQGEQTSPKREATPQAQNNNETQAKILLDRARQLAIAAQFEDAIAEANKIPFDNPLYQQAIAQWSEQAYQREAEQRAIQQSNQQHLQAAQQALDQDDWETALQEVNQINVNAMNQNPFWQQQRDSMMQKLEPYQHEHKAREFLDQDEFKNAHDEASLLPPVAPWNEKRAIILEKISQRLADKNVAEKWNTRCRAWSQNNMSRCPYLDEWKNLADLLPSARWLPRPNSPSRKSRH